MTSSVHANNRTENNLVAGQGITELNDKTLATEASYSINFSMSNTIFWLRLHYNAADSYLFVTATEILKFKANNSEIKAYDLCLGNLSENYSANNILKTGLKGSVLDVSVGCGFIDTSNIINIHYYLMKKNGIQYKMC